MKTKLVTCLQALLVLLFGLTVAAMAQAQSKEGVAPPAPYNKKDYEWLDTPWKVRYLIRISRNMPRQVRWDTSWNEEKDMKKSPAYRKFLPHFTPTYLLPPSASDQSLLKLGMTVDGPMGFVVIEFDRSGKVITPHTTSQPLVGKTGSGYNSSTGENLRELFLVEGDATPGNNWYLIGNWFEGFRSGAGSEVSPALCDFYIDDHRYQAQANPLRAEKYEPFKVEFNIGLVGCREWAWQRNRSEQQPYIDVSTYPSPEYLKKYPSSQPFIMDVLGWGGFDDPRRPVIGRYRGQWLCLHDCPDGEAPGVIDIKAWTTQRGWPLPKPLPFFPDNKFKGRHVD